MGLVTEIYAAAVPKACLLCGDYAEDNALFCDECGKYALHLSRVCPVCGSFLPLENFPCHFCATYSASEIDRFFSPYIYAGAIAKAITEMKYPGNRRAAAVLARHLAFFLPDAYKNASLIIYPPMSRIDRYKRGFNQAALLAETISQMYGIPLGVGVIKKRKKTEKQASLHGKERVKNLSGAFELSKPTELDRVIVVDDVITTASTVNEIGRVLKKAGATEVYALSIARTSLYFS